MQEGPESLDPASLVTPPAAPASPRSSDETVPAPAREVGAHRKLRVAPTLWVDARGDRAVASKASLPGEGDVVGGRYRLGALLGAGQFGRVHRARRTDMPQHAVALKVLGREVYEGRDPEHELRLLSAVAHPHVVQLADHGVEADHVWFTMPLYDGGTLDERLARGPLSLREAFEIFAPVADGLCALHAVGLRHQDMKPENVFLATFHGSRFPLVLDLGAAAPARGVGPVAGTLAYAAPEQARAILTCLALAEGHASAGEPRLDLTEAIDVYGLACTLLRALTGPGVFPDGDIDEAGDVDDARARIERAFEERERTPLPRQALPKLRGVARAKLEQALRGWLAIDPARRPSMAGLRVELEVLLEGERAGQRARTARRAGMAIVAAAALVAASGWGLKRRGDESLGRCARELSAAQSEAVSRVSSLDQCKGLLSHEAASARLCLVDLDAERQLRLTRGDDPTRAFAARLDRCEFSRTRAVEACERERDAEQARADALEPLLARAVRERDELTAELKQLRAGPTPPIAARDAARPPSTEHAATTISQGNGAAAPPTASGATSAAANAATAAATTASPGAIASGASTQPIGSSNNATTPPSTPTPPPAASAPGGSSAPRAPTPVEAAQPAPTAAATPPAQPVAASPPPPPGAPPRIGGAASSPP